MHRHSARSILCEALINHLGQGRFKGYSAGSRPTGQVNPFALKTLERYGISAEGYRSKSWDEFGAEGAPRMDFGFTLCGSAAGETCPVWPGHPLRVHWGVEDPAALEGSDEAIATAGLLLTILGGVRHARDKVPLLVALYIVAAYWFTASTSFANPAVTSARSLTDIFAGIRPSDVPGFVLAQLAGAALSGGTGCSPCASEGESSL